MTEIRRGWITGLAFLGLVQTGIAQTDSLVIDREAYAHRLEGFWLGTCIANWTGLITEMDKIGGTGNQGTGAGFYTRENWNGPDEPNIWNSPSPDDTIRFQLVSPDSSWGADDDTDIEYMYQYQMDQTGHPLLSPGEIRQAWLTHIRPDEENYLWVSNQQAYDLMRAGMLPPRTSDPDVNPHSDMIDAQLTTELFGLLAPGRPDVALRLAELPIRTTASGDARLIAGFHVRLFSLVAGLSATSDAGPETLPDLIADALSALPAGSVPDLMARSIRQDYRNGLTWEAARDSLHERFQIRQTGGYRWWADDPACHGCFAAGINFGAGLISLIWGNGDFRETIRIGTLIGWDSDNPTATWGGLLGFMMGRESVERVMGKPLSQRFFIHRTRQGFPGTGMDTFPSMARTGIRIIDRVVSQQMNGRIRPDSTAWVIPPAPVQP